MKIANVYFLTIALLCVLSTNCHSQEKSQKVKVYRIWISGQVDIDGMFYEATDSSILIISKNDFKILASPIPIEVKVTDIGKIKTRRLNRVGRGAAIGAISTALPAMAFFGLMEYSFEGKGDIDKAILFGAVFGGAVGTGIGAAFGSIKTKYKIDYSKDLYRIQRAKFERKSLKTQTN